MKEPLVVDVQNMDKSYQMGHGIVTALQGVSLQAKKGDSIAIMGPSGSGKSTLMHLIGCLDKPTRGHYFFNEQNILELDDIALSLIRATQIGFVFQSYNLIPQLTVLENVEIPFIYCHERMNKKEIRSAAMHSLERVGLSHRIHHLPSELSGGEMQRVAIARALVIDPSLILADEPTGNLDYETGHAIMSLFQELNAQGVTLIVVTHDESVGSYCNRLIHMKDGRVQCQ